MRSMTQGEDALGLAGRIEHWVACQSGLRSKSAAKRKTETSIPAGERCIYGWNWRCVAACDGIEGSGQIEKKARDE
eukprot:3908669-Pleurochrysis_carterae.AAC.2